MVGKIPKDVIAIAESGLKTNQELLTLNAKGFHGFLIGETLALSPNPGKTLETMRAQ